MIYCIRVNYRISNLCVFKINFWLILSNNYEGKDLKINDISVGIFLNYINIH